MKDKFNKLFPKYIFIPLGSAILFNFITYFCSKLITNNFYHYDIASSFDKALPFVPAFIIIYILAFLQWIIGYIVIARESREVCYKYLSAELIAKFMCLIFFFVFPTTLVRPEVESTNFCLFLVNFIYFTDAPVNLFPSIHCLESWMVFRGSLSCYKINTLYKVLMFIFSLLVFASVVLVKQHVLIDIIGGILVVEIGIFIANKFNTGRIFYFLEEVFSKNKDDNNEREEKE